MGKDTKQIAAYWAIIQKYRQAGYDGTTARRKAYEATFGTNVKTVYENGHEEAKENDGLAEEKWIEDPDRPGEFRIADDSGSDSQSYAEG